MRFSSGQIIGRLSSFSLFVVFTFLAGCATSVAPNRSTSISSDVIEVPVSGRMVENQDIKAEQLFVRGLTRAFMGDFRGALDVYEQVTELSTDEPAVLSAIAEAHENLGEFPTAVFYAERAVELAPNNVHYRQQLAGLHLRSGNTKNAAHTYRRLVDRFPNNTIALHELARILASTDQYQESIQTYEQLLKVIGNNAEVYNELLQLHLRLGNTAGAERTLKSWIEMEPGNISMMHMLGDLYRQQDRAEEAAEIFEQILRIEPNDYESAVSLSELYRHTGMNGKADSLLEAQKSMEGASADQLVKHATAVLASSNDLQVSAAAVQLLERALQLDNNNADALLLLGELRLRTGDYERAADHFYRILQNNPRDLTLWHQTANAFLQAGNEERAIEVAEEGILLFPGHLDLFTVSGYALMDLHNNAAAIDRFEEAVVIAQEELPEDTTLIAEIHSALALLYWREKNFSRSDSLYELALSENESDASTLNNYAYSLAERGTNLGTAMKLARRAVDLDGENPSFLDTLGWVHFMLGQYDAALEWIGKAAGHDQASAATLEHLGDVHAKLGNKSLAIEYWRKSLDKNPDNSILIEKLEN